MGEGSGVGRATPLGSFALSLGGLAFTAIAFIAMAQAWGWPGKDAQLWQRVGADVLAGTSPYTVAGPGGFFYAPPWAVGFAVVSWLPVGALAAAILILEVVALRYVAGSWLRVGYLCWLPIVPLELIGSQWNLVVAAGIALALRGEPHLAVVTAFAKISPALAINTKQWRPAMSVALGLVAVTLPWLSLWPEWVRQLNSTYGINIAPGAEVMLPLAPRLAAAVVLLVVGWRRPRARGLAAIIATPVVYWVSGVLLFALLPSVAARSKQ